MISNRKAKQITHNILLATSLFSSVAVSVSFNINLLAILFFHSRGWKAGIILWFFEDRVVGGTRCYFSTSKHTSLNLCLPRIGRCTCRGGLVEAWDVPNPINWMGIAMLTGIHTVDFLQCIFYIDSSHWRHILSATNWKMEHRTVTPHGVWCEFHYSFVGSVPGNKLLQMLTVCQSFVLTSDTVLACSVFNWNILCAESLIDSTLFSETFLWNCRLLLT